MNHQPPNLTILASELAALVPAMALDSSMNNAHLIQGKLEAAQRELLAELTTAKEKLAAVRRACLEIDSNIVKDPSRWRGSLQWATGEILGVVKYGDGYSDSNAPKRHAAGQPEQPNPNVEGIFPLALRVADD